MKLFLQNSPFILLEGAVIEPLRRDQKIKLHPRLMNADLIYCDLGRTAMGKLYNDYLTIAKEASVPFVMCTPTWRANLERVQNSSASYRINQDAAQFINEIRMNQGRYQAFIKIGGLLGCKNDCYQPEAGLSDSEAEDFHSWQIEQLAEGGVDFLFASTLPGTEEALGMARAMSRVNIPYLLSFVISRHGEVLDGTPLDIAVQYIDDKVSCPPAGYMVNCSYPAFLCADKQSPQLFKRLVGFQANASALDHKELDGSEDIRAESISDWSDAMWDLHQMYGLKILGGCCGTGNEHLKALVGKNRSVMNPD